MIPAFTQRGKEAPAPKLKCVDNDEPPPHRVTAAQATEQTEAASRERHQTGHTKHGGAAVPRVARGVPGP